MKSAMTYRRSLTILAGLWLSSCGDTSTSQLDAVNNTQTVRKFIDVMSGVDINTASAGLQGDALSAVWDYYKAYQGNTGENRRLWVRAGETHGKAYKTGVDKATLRALTLKVDDLYIKAYKEAKTYTYTSRVYNYVSTMNVTYLNNITAVLNKVPVAQRETLDPIFIVNKLPGGRETGGGYYLPTEVGTWIGKVAETGVADQDVIDYAQASGRGIIAITKDALNKQTGQVYQFSILHEASHSIDKNYKSIIPPNVTAAKFIGQYYPRNPTSVPELSAETYSRYLFSPSRICRDDKVLDANGNETDQYKYIPAPDNAATCKTKMTELIKKAPIFL